ncbi:hypothetical protein Bealeia1_02046 (plasmid) [Candidatus Bealeia paramacronuclearis]|uniref:Pre-toxin TG domain-containing protein n=1 Tax=Candidatus Bealeia paramacronuclearis TaxID=1921001 RepID=A0ABZ2C5R8_9PROT
MCTWNDWALASLEADPDRAKGIAAGLYAGNYLLPMLLGTIESWINPEGQAPLTVGLLSAFHKEMQTVGHGLTAAINALNLDAEEKAAYGALVAVGMAGVMKGVKDPTNGKALKDALSEANVLVKSAQFHSGLDKKALSRLPKELGVVKEASKDSQIGVRWQDKHADRYVRIMKGRPDEKFASQQQDYLQIRSGGQVVLRDGTRVEKTQIDLKPKLKEEAHIPYKEWIEWKEWDKP